MTRTFTTTTWADLGDRYLNRNNGTGAHGAKMMYWDDQHDLAVQLAEAQPALTFGQARELVSATCSGMPVTLTWRTRMTGELRHRIQVTTATVIIEDLGRPGHDLRSMPGHAQIRYWGFGYCIYLNEITAVEVPPTTYTFEDVQ